MRWLLVKDLQILRRSPLLVVLLVAYPILVALLIGFALSGGPEKPRVAFVNEVPAGEGTFTVGGQTRDATTYADRLFEKVDPIRVKTRKEALDLVASGEALGALIIPADAADRLRSSLSLSGGGERPQVEVVYNGEDPLKRRFVESTIESTLSEANLALSKEITKVGASYLDILLKGGSIDLFFRKIDVLGLQRSAQVLDGLRDRFPEGTEQRRELDAVQRFAQLAVENLDLSDAILASIAEPVTVKQTVLRGSRTPLDAYAVAVAVAISLMFVCVLLAAGMLALEREEHAFGRLVRGLVSRTTLLAEKVALSALCSFALGALLVAGLSLFVDIAWSQAPLWLLALLLGAAGFGALGVAIGAAAREVRAASLLAFLLSLPIAFLALVPSGTVAPALYDVIQAISALFPFDPTLDALDRTLNDSGQSVAGPLLHLAALVAGWGVVGRVALRRFGS
ncbi:MAG TPA: ABC transporter permease [Solirubrobacteraceae bacterium]|nr:ABC transporter permease [Solirubrobacteraceae bacterium]